MMPVDEKYATYHEMAIKATMDDPNLRVHTTKKSAYEEFMMMVNEFGGAKKLSSQDVAKLLRFAYVGVDLHYKVDDVNN